MEKFHLIVFTRCKYIQVYSPEECVEYSRALVKRRHEYSYRTNVHGTIFTSTVLGLNGFGAMVRRHFSPRVSPGGVRTQDPHRRYLRPSPSGWTVWTDRLVDRIYHCPYGPETSTSDQ